jgi:DNA-binding CsgD family transcriptional regulator
MSRNLRSIDCRENGVHQDRPLVGVTRQSSNILNLARVHVDQGKHRRKAAARPVGEVVRQHRLSQTELDELLATYARGAGTIELARQFGVHRDAVRRHLNRARVLRPRQALNPAQVQRAVELRAAGMLFWEIGAVLGVSMETARKTVRGAS